jgi:Protein of unknown function (DUF3575)
MNKFILFTLFLLVFQTVDAQDATTSAKRRAIISIAPLSLAKSSGQVKLRGEYVINARKSATLTIGIPKKLTLPSNFGDYLITNDQGNAKISNAASNTKLFSTLLDFRFYKASKGAPRGFYYAPYLKFLKGNMDLVIPYTDLNYTETFSATGISLGAGLNLGVNWIIKNRVSIDWTFLSLGLQSVTSTGSYNTTEPDVNVQEYTDDVVRNLGRIPLIGNKFKVAADGDNVSIKLKNQFLPDGAMRLTIGVAF